MTPKTSMPLRQVGKTTGELVAASLHAGEDLIGRQRSYPACRQFQRQGNAFQAGAERCKDLRVLRVQHEFRHTLLGAGDKELNAGELHEPFRRVHQGWNRKRSRNDLHLSGEAEPLVRAGYGQLFQAEGIPLDPSDPARLVLFPEMDARVDVPEITEACWGILHKSPDDVMCASSRMVVKRHGAAHPVVLACTLLAYDKQFELGRTLAEASRAAVAFNHPHCASFCVLGGAACSR